MTSIVTTYIPMDETSTSSTSSQTSFDWLVGKTVWIKWFLHEQDLWYKCVVHYGMECDYVVQSTNDAIARFNGVYEFFPTGFDEKSNERADHIWQLTYFHPEHNNKRVTRKNIYRPKPGDIVMVKWTMWETNPPWYCCVVRHGGMPKKCPLVVESRKMSEPNFEGVYEFWPSGTNAKGESVDHIWERVFSIEDPKLNRYVQSSDEFSQVMSQSLLQQHHHHYSLPEPFLLQQMKHVRGKTNSNENQQMIVERLQCPPDAKPGEKVNFTFCGKVYKYTVPSNVPKNRMIDVHFPIFSTSKKKIKKVKAKKLRRSKRVPLGPPPSRQDFIDFMIARESLRINKMNHHEDPSKWTDDSVLREYKFTNVKREHDRTTIAFRKITDSRKPLFREISSLASRPRKRHQKDDDESWKKEIYEREIKEAGLMVFNCCVQRQFGTTIFAQAMGYFTEWGPETIDRVAKKCIDLLFEKGKLMFSGAYMPQSIYRNAEKRAMFHNNPELAIRWYREMCKRLTNVWNIRDKIARLARETKSWETVVKCLAKCPWFGGSMFHSKEAVQDMIHTFVFQRPNEDGKTWTCECIDLDSFCPIGPGARRGLNRLAGRATSHAVERTKSEQVSIFYKEAMSLFEEVKTKWPGTILNVKVERLHLHDIQFQLCEFDKYQRVKSGYMKGKRYKHCSEENEIAEREDSEAASIYRERTKKVQDLKKRKRQKLEAEKMMKKKLISNSDELLMVTPKKRRHYVSRVISPTFKSRLEQDAVAHILSPLEQQKTGAVVVS